MLKKSCPGILVGRNRNSFTPNYPITYHSILTSGSRTGTGMSSQGPKWEKQEVIQNHLWRYLLKNQPNYYRQNQSTQELLEFLPDTGGAGWRGVVFEGVELTGAGLSARQATHSKVSTGPSFLNPGSDPWLLLRWWTTGPDREVVKTNHEVLSGDSWLVTQTAWCTWRSFPPTHCLAAVRPWPEGLAFKVMDSYLVRFSYWGKKLSSSQIIQISAIQIFEFQLLTILDYHGRLSLPILDHLK